MREDQGSTSADGWLRWLPQPPYFEAPKIVGITYLSTIHRPAGSPVRIELKGWGWLSIRIERESCEDHEKILLLFSRYISGRNNLREVTVPKGARLVIHFANIKGGETAIFDVPCHHQEMHMFGDLRPKLHHTLVPTIYYAKPHTLALQSFIKRIRISQFSIHGWLHLTLATLPRRPELIDRRLINSTRPVSNARTFINMSLYNTLPEDCSNG